MSETGAQPQRHSRPLSSRWTTAVLCAGSVLLYFATTSAESGSIVGNISDAQPSEIVITKIGNDGRPVQVKVGADVEEGATLSISDWCGLRRPYQSGYVKVNTQSGPVILYCQLLPHTRTFTHGGVTIPPVGEHHNPPSVPTITSELNGTIDELRKVHKNIAEARVREARRVAERQRVSERQKVAEQPRAPERQPTPGVSASGPVWTPPVAPSGNIAGYTDPTQGPTGYTFQVLERYSQMNRLCSTLRHQQNMLYHAYGYCFKDPAVIAYFGNEGCSHVSEDELPPEAQWQRALIAGAEATYCK